MVSQTLLQFPFTCQGLLNLTFDRNLTASRSRKAVGADHWTVHRQAVGFTRPASQSPPCASPRSTSSGELSQHQSVHTRRSWGTKNLSMGGGSTLPHPVVAASEVRGASATSRLEDGDGVVIVDHGSRRAQSNAMLHEFVKMYKEETGHKLVEAAHMELATPTIADAFDRCVEQGASRVIICPYFLFPGRHWDKDIPVLAAEAAKKHPQVSYLVTAPIGLHKLMVTVIQDRMEYCLSHTAGEVSECDMCKGTGRCKQLISSESQLTTDTSIDELSRVL
ncbi:unnamed protein product [Calypogeia fissa]